MIDEEYKYIEMFRERPVLQQIAVGFIDPTILVSWAAKGSKIALMLTRTDAFAARAARGVPGIGESWAARISPDIFESTIDTNMVRAPKVRPIARKASSSNSGSSMAATNRVSLLAVVLLKM